jgi:hypothetical protein
MILSTRPIREGTMEDLSAFSARPRLRALLDHFAKIKDTRQAWKVMYPLREVLFLVVCGTIASGDDYDDIVDWGKAHPAFLRGFAEFHLGVSCADRLRSIMNRIDPDLFMDCFTSAELEAEVARRLAAAEASDAAEDQRYGAEKSGEEMPDWVADKKRRAERIRKAKAELEAEARAAAEAKFKAAAQREAEGRKKPGRPAVPPSSTPESKAQKELHRSGEPDHEEQGRLRAGVQCPNRGR